MVDKHSRWGRKHAISRVLKLVPTTLCLSLRAGVKNDTHVRTTFQLLWVLKITPMFVWFICWCGYKNSTRKPRECRL